MSGWFGNKTLDEQIARATSESLPTGTEDMFLSLEIADQIRSKAVAPKEAMRALKRRINHKNPNVQLAALKLTDTCVKNGGDHFLIEIASREFMDNLVALLKATGGLNLDVKNKILEETQIWSQAFEGRPHLSYVKTIVTKLKADGFQFPDVAPVNASYVDSSAPPEWADSDRCMRCHTPFTLTNRKHHCRNCGNVYCNDCSSKTMPLPHLGIAQPVRVCETCYEEKNSTKLKSPSISSPPVGQSAATSSAMQPRSARVEDDDDKDLKMALAMSLEEAKRMGINADAQAPSKAFAPAPVVQNKPAPVVSAVAAPKPEEEDEDLKAAIAASLKDMETKKALENSYAAPVAATVPEPVPSTSTAVVGSASPTNGVPSTTQYQYAPSNELTPLEAENITLFATLIDRMQSAPPGTILREPHIQELYEAVSALKPKLGRTLSNVVGKYESLVDMHAKLNTVVRYYDKMLEDRLATTYSHATYQDTRPLPPSQTPYSYNLPPQSPAPSQQAGYFPSPSRRSTFSEVNVPHESPGNYYTAQQPPANPPAMNTSQNWGYAPPQQQYPPPTSPTINHQAHPSQGESYNVPPPSQYGDVSSPVVEQHPSTYQQPPQQPLQPPPQQPAQQPAQQHNIYRPPSLPPPNQVYQAPPQNYPSQPSNYPSHRPSYPSYLDSRSGYPNQSQPLQQREESSLIDL